MDPCRHCQLSRCRKKLLCRSRYGSPVRPSAWRLKLAEMASEREAEGHWLYFVFLYLMWHALSELRIPPHIRFLPVQWKGGQRSRGGVADPLQSHRQNRCGCVRPGKIWEGCRYVPGMEFRSEEIEQSSLSMAKPNGQDDGWQDEVGSWGCHCQENLSCPRLGSGPV